MSARMGWATDLLGRLLVDRSDHARLVRGKELADLGRVYDIELDAGRLRANVSGSRMKPYRVTVKVPATAGPPRSARSLTFDCTCPDWGDPCKHAIALTLTAAARFDDDRPLAASFWGADEEEEAAVAMPAASTPRPSRPAGVGGQRASSILPVERPGWADTLAPVVAPSSVAEWFGSLPTTTRSTLVLGRDPLDDVLALGPLLVGDEWDIAPAIQVLLMTLHHPGRSSE